MTSHPLLAEIMRLALAPVGGYHVVVPLALALVLLLWWGPGRGRVSAGRRRVLASLRLLVFVLVTLAMLRPTVVWTEITKQSATLIMLADRSRSMLVADAVGNKTRWEALGTALADALPALRALEDDLEVKLYTFDAAPRAVDLTAGEPELGGPPDGAETAIGAALEEALRLEAGKRLAGVILLGDGAQRAYPPRDVPPQVPARRLGDLGCRLYTVAFGQARGQGQSRDVALDELLTSEQIFVKNELAVTGSVRLDGLVNQTVPVQLLVETSPGKMEPVATARLQARQDGQRLPIALEYVPQVPGEIKVTLFAAAQPGELVTTNNQTSTFVTVRKGGLNVLYLNGALLPEQRHIRWALDASPDINVDYFYIRADKPETRPPDLAQRFQPGKYDAYVIGALDGSAFREGELAQLAAAVERGAGFIMLGGLYSFAAGGYGQTPLAAVLPIEMDRFDRQNPGEKIRDDLHLLGKLRMKPTQLGQTQSLLLLAARDENPAAWARLPPLAEANRFRQDHVKRSAQVLAETDGGQPLLVAHDYGNGRVIAFAADSTWRWWLEGHEAAHKRFWRQTVLWLARKDQSTEGNVWIKLDQRRYSPGARVEFTVGAESPQGEPLADALFQAEVVLPGGTKRPVRLRRQGDQMQGSLLETQAAGDYTLVVKATASGEEVGTGRARFLVFEHDLELTNPAADLGALESLAAMTSGKRIAPEQLPGLLAELKEAARQLEVETEAKETLWDRWPFFFMFIGLLVSEWFLRKKWGLV